MKINLEKELKREVEKIKKLGFPISDNITICTEKLSNCYGYARGFDYIALNDDFINAADIKEIRAVIASDSKLLMIQNVRYLRRFSLSIFTK